jgi:dolichol-phosphate mannosyltransferase
LLHRLADIDIPLDAGDFCAMSRRIDHLNRLPETDRFVRGLRACRLPPNRHSARARRRAGIPKYTLAKLVQLFRRPVVVLYAPLRWLAVVGFVLCTVSFVGILIVLYRYCSHHTCRGTRPGHPRPVFGGAQFLTGGLVGEYVGRTAQQVKGRPLYVVDELIGFPEGPALRPFRR